MALDELDLRAALRILPVPLRRLTATAEGELRLAALLPTVSSTHTGVLDDIALDKYTFIRDAYLQRRGVLTFDQDDWRDEAAPTPAPASAPAPAVPAASASR